MKFLLRENQGEKERSVINIVCVGALYIDIILDNEFRSTGQREVGEEISVLILLIDLGRYILKISICNMFSFNLCEFYIYRDFHNKMNC